MKSDQYWIIGLLIPALMAFILLPLGYDGLCKKEEINAIGICTREWMTAVGTLFTPIIVAIIAIKLQERQYIQSKLNNREKILSDMLYEYEKFINNTSPFALYATLKSSLRGIAQRDVDKITERAKILEEDLREKIDILSRYRITHIDEDLLTARKNVIEAYTAIWFDVVTLYSMLAQNFTDEYNNEVIQGFLDSGLDFEHSSRLAQEYRRTLAGELERMKKLVEEIDL